MRDGVLPQPIDETSVPRPQQESHSYDDRQRLAELRACVVCGRSFYMSHPQEVCISCR